MNPWSDKAIFGIVKQFVNLPIHNPQNKEEFISLIKRAFDKFNDPNDPWFDALQNSFLGNPDRADNPNPGGSYL